MDMDTYINVYVRMVRTVPFFRIYASTSSCIFIHVYFSRFQIKYNCHDKVLDAFLMLAGPNISNCVNYL